ncbi:NADH-quinone oxidoreductase subunit NuoE [Oceanicella sp. SM1341]|uniref:NADH-quinone oxidoreductase subunit NuoE n=1 Tax=Oceanicella sp. SM1341 TaxID=1548889 RepID=UPI000E556A93|nr:NADH-quinone oxidoreductase subunit NuoE [Oceanicella sp. SM1341]
MLRRLHPEQPESFAFTDANLEWAKQQLLKYPEGRQASAVIPLLWRAQEQEGWVSRPAIEYVAELLGMAYIRVLEVATFYFMFQLQPVGKIAHVQVCGTTSCMICGAEDLISVCREKIAPHALEISGDGKFSWEEVECLGACANAPMVQIGKDFYEDLTRESFIAILDALARGEVPVPGSQSGRFAAEPAGGVTALKQFAIPQDKHNASVARAVALGDTIARITGEEEAYSYHPGPATQAEGPATDPEPEVPAEGERQAQAELHDAETKGRPERTDHVEESGSGAEPERLDAPRGGAADDLKQIKGLGPKAEEALNALGIYHLDQIAAWSEDNLLWVEAQVDFLGTRPERDNWVAMARALVGDEKTTG